MTRCLTLRCDLDLKRITRIFILHILQFFINFIPFFHYNLYIPRELTLGNFYFISVDCSYQNEQT